jgi:aspartate kinase
MKILTMKFGGTSVANVERIKAVRDIISREVKNGWNIVAVVSAMSNETNKLIDLAKQIGIESLVDAEYDSLISTGEDVSSSLLALSLKNKGISARSWRGWQLPVKTDNFHSNAKINTIDTNKLIQSFDQGTKVGVVSGFQGISEGDRITTLGRGGSDTSAVAIAASINAKRCDIYTDVSGIYTTDPRIKKNASKLKRISFEEMLEMASLGANVLQTRAVELAMRNKVPITVLNSFSEEEGTLVCDEEEIMEKNIVSGIAFQKNEAQITLTNIEDKPGVAAKIFGPLASSGINIDMIVQSNTETGLTNLTFSCPADHLDLAKKAISKAKDSQLISYERLIENKNLAKVSIVGIGMKTHAGVAQKMFETLSEENININVISTSEIKISVLIERKYLELAVRSLHDAFGLDKL